ncbi:MAG: AcrR family transcriptional regulator [Halioglobus sp.]|jgi:AcrR family transcriptional regulator
MSKPALNNTKEISPKGKIARAKLKTAALEVMERVGYHRMRITDVTVEAGVASGLFYHYFKDLKSLTLQVLQDFVSHSLHLDDIEKNVPKGDWYERMLAHNRLVVLAYAERPGIMRALLQLADEDEEFSQLLRNNFVQQLSWLTRQMPKLFPAAGMSNHQAMMVVYALAGTGETILRDYYINHESVLHAEELTVEQMTELITVMFYRGLFLQNPPAEKLRYTANLGEMKKKIV